MMIEEQKKIIILETDHARKDYFKTILSREGYIAFCFDNMANCFDNIDQLDADLIILCAMTGVQTVQCINALIAIKCRLPLLLVSDDPNVRQYLATNQLDNIDLVDSTFEPVMLTNAIQTVLEKEKTHDLTGFSSSLVGNSPALLRIKQCLPELARLNESVLITGEPGTGKEVLARAIHSASGDDIGRFVKINASELNKDDSFSLLIELNKKRLNHKAGDNDLKDGGLVRWTIYLDELGALPDHLQAELLLIAGAGNDNFRILSGTIQEMEKLVAKNRFRKDLYYRLNVLSLKMPPLRHRREDIPLLTDFFTYKFCREFDKTCLVISNRLKNLFMHYHWPGNVRELQDIVKRAMLTGEEKMIISNLQLNNPENELRIRKKWDRELDSIEEMTRKKEYLGQVGEMSLKDICWNFMAKVERRVMRAALEATNWNRKKAAIMLNISYKSMLNKIKTYGLV